MLQKSTSRATVIRFILIQVATLVLLTTSSYAQRYWVGGTGSWSDTNHWSTTSGGDGGASVPSSSENAVFDANSFSAAGQTVTLDVDGECKDFLWTGATNTPTFTGAADRTLTVHDNHFTLIGNMTYSFAGTLVFVRTGGNLNIELGDVSKTFGNMTFQMESDRDATIKTTGADNADTFIIGEIDVDNSNDITWDLTATNIEFGNIDLASSCDWTINNAEVSTYDNVTLNEFNRFQINSLNNTIDGTLSIDHNWEDEIAFDNTNTFNGAVLINGASQYRSRIQFRGSTFNSTVTLQNNTEANFYDGAVFNGLVTIGAGTDFADGSRCEVQFINNTTFNAGLTVGDYALIEFGDDDGGAIADAETIFSGTSAITFGNDLDLTFKKNVTIDGNLTFGNDCEVDFNGSNNLFKGTVTMGSQSHSGREIYFNNTNTFEKEVTATGSHYDSHSLYFYNSTFRSDLTLQGTDPKARFDNNCTFDGLVSVSDGGIVRFRRSDVFNNGATFGNNVDIRFTNADASGTSTTFNTNAPVIFGTDAYVETYYEFSTGGDLTFGNDADLTFRKDVSIGGDLSIGEDSEVDFAGNDDIFKGTVTIASQDLSGRNVRFDNSNTFEDAVIINGNQLDTDRIIFENSTFKSTVELLGSNPKAKFDDDCTFDGLVTVEDGGSVRFMESDVFNAGASFGNDVFVRFTDENIAGSSTTFNTDATVTFGTGVDVVADQDFIISGDLSFGNDPSKVQFSGSENIFHGDVTFGTDARARFNNLNTFNGKVTIGSVEGGSNDVFRFFGSTFNDVLSVTGSSTTTDGFRFYGSEFNELVEFIDGKGQFENSCAFHNSVDIQGGEVDFRHNDTFDNSQNASATFVARNATVEFSKDGGSSDITTFSLPVTFGTGLDVSTRRSAVFNNTLTIENNIVNARFAYNSGSTIHNDDVTIGNNNTVEYEGYVTFTEPSGTTLLTVGENSTLNLDTRSGDNTFFDITCLEGATINFNPYNNSGVDASTIRNLTLSNFNEIVFSRYKAATITSMIADVGAGGCEEWIYLRSSDTGNDNDRGLVSFASDHTFTGVIAWKVNVTSSNLTIDYGKDLGRNLGITFNTAPPRASALNFYWIGGRDGLTKKFGNNENWNNPSNWTVGNAAFSASDNNNGCTPVEGDNVYFNTNSFTSAGKQVVANTDVAFHDMDWTGSLHTPEFTESGTYTFNIDGKVTLIGDMTSNFRGNVNYISDEAEILETADHTFGQTITFNNTTGSWQSNGAINCTGTLSLEEGILDLSAYNTSVSCKKFIMNSTSDLARILNYGGTGTITVTGSGTGTDPVVDMRGNNLTILPTHDETTIPQTSNWAFTVLNQHIDIQWGDAPLNIGNISISINGNKDAKFYSGAVATDLFTYGDLTFGDYSDAMFYGDSKKQFGSLQAGIHTSNEFNGEEIHFTGNLNYDKHYTSCTVNGTTNTFQGLTIGINEELNDNFRFYGTNTFYGDVSIDGSCSNTDRIQFYNSTFEQTFTMEYATRGRTIGPALFKGLVTLQDGISTDYYERAFIRFIGDATFQGGAEFGNYSWVRFNDNSNGTFTQFEGNNTLNFGDYVEIDFYEDLLAVEDASNNAPPITIGNNTIRFEADENIVVDNTFTIGDNSTYIRFCNDSGEGTFGDAVSIGQNNSTIYFERDNEFASSLSIGNGSVIQINDNDSISVFKGDVVIGNDAEIEFRKKNTFEQDLTIGVNATATFSQESSNATQAAYTLVMGNVDIQNGATVSFRRENEFQGTFDTSSDVYLIFNTSNNNSTFKGAVTLGDNNEGYFERNNIFESDVIVGDNTDLTFNRINNDTEFKRKLTIGNSGNTTFERKVDFYGDVLFGTQARSSFNNNTSSDYSTTVHTKLKFGTDNEADFFGDLTFSTATIDDAYELEIGKRSIVTLNMRGDVDEDAVFQDIHLSEEARLSFSNRNNSIRNLHTKSYNIVELSTHGTTTVSNEFTASVSCNEWLIVRSDVSGTGANIQFTTKKQDWSNIVVQDLTVLGPTSDADKFALEISEGVNLDNLSVTTNDGSEIDPDPTNTNYKPDKTIYLKAERTPKTLYWIGKNTSTPNWNNTGNWSETSGGTSSGCIPNPIDKVVFDNNSFSDDGQKVIINIANAACGDFSWESTKPGIMEGDALSTLQVYEDFSVNDNWDNQFLGTVEFYSAKSISREISQTSGANTINFYGPIKFSASYGITSSPYNWKFNDAIDINDGDDADIYDNVFCLHQGYIWANGQNINLEGNWATLTDGHYVHGDNEVTLDGDINNVTVVSNDQSFYNLTINKSTANKNVQLITNDLYIDNDLSISSGSLWDSNKATSTPVTIHATETGTITIDANGTLLLGSNNSSNATTFPNFGFYNLDDASTVYFRHRDGYDQNIQNTDNEPTAFGNLILSNARDGNGGNDSNITYKHLLAPVTINGSLSILNRTTFNDQGFQVTGNTDSTLTMEQHSTFIVGDENDGTSFPQFNTYDLGNNTNVIYNSGVVQPIRGIDDGGISNGSYANLTIVNSDSTNTTSPVLKTIDNLLRVRRELRIYEDNHLWDGGNQITALDDNDCELFVEPNSIITLGSADSATTFPSFQSDEIFLDENSTIIYASGAVDDQLVRRLANGDDSDRSYGNLKLINIDSVAHINGKVKKILAATPTAQNNSNTLKVRGDLYIGQYNDLLDAGYQINGHSTNGGTITLADNSILTLGSSTTATLFPANFDEFEINLNSEVIYYAGVAQTVKGLYNSGDLNANDNYGHVTITNSSGSTLIKKTLDAALNVRGNLTIRTNNNLADDGFQIYGGTSGTNTIEVEGGANLTLGGDATDSENTVFPNFGVTNLHHGDSPTSTVYYTSNREDAVQEVAGLDYGNLVITSVDANVSTEKALQAATNIHGNLEITTVDSGEEIIFDDNGLQITGNATGTIILGAQSTLQLGNGTTATKFPLTFLRNNANVILDDASSIIFNAGDGTADLPQLIPGGFDYGNVTLTNPTASVQVNKQLEANIQVDGSLTVNTQNHLIDDGYQITGNNGASSLFVMAADSKLTLGKSGADDYATSFPLLFLRDNTNIQLDDASEVVYNGGDDNTVLPQMVAGGFNYGKITFTNPTGSSNVEKRLEAAIAVDGNFVINTLNTITDKGFQITGNASSNFSMAANSTLNIGEGASTTTFPTNFVASNISLNETSTVDYRATSDQEIAISPGDGTTGSGYGNLILSQDNSTLVNKTLTGGGVTGAVQLKIQGNLTIDKWNHFLDAGYQIEGPDVAGKTLEMGISGNAGGDARLVLGRGTDDAAWDNYATYMPRGWDNRVTGTDPGQIHPTESTIEYKGGRSQEIDADFPYGNLILSIDGSTNEIGSNRVRKYLNTYNAATSVNVYGDITVGGTVNLDDDGIQITAQATSSFTLNDDADLTLGNTTSATKFPLNIIDSNLALSDNSTVIYNAGIAQEIRALYLASNQASDRNYGNLTINNPGGGNPTKTIKTDGDIRIRGDFEIGNNNVTEMDISTLNIYLGGNWTNNGSFTINQSNVIFEGGSMQEVTSGSSKFHDIKIDNNSGIELQDDLTVDGASSGTINFTNGHVLSNSGSEELIFEDGSSFSNAGANSNSNAKVRKIGSTDFTFPVGTSSSYNPIGISDLSSSSAFTAEYKSGSPDASYDVGSRDASLHHVSVREYWLLNRVTGSASAKVTLHWNNPNTDMQTPSDLRVAHWNGSSWENAGNTAVSAMGATGYITSEEQSNFSPFTFASLSGFNLLPVELISFDTEHEKEVGVHLTWKTVNELDNAGFILSRSVGDETHFEEIASYKTETSLEGKSNADVLNTYKFLDDKDISPGEVHYYRLQQVDFNGEITTFPIKAVNIGAKVILNQNYPNPASNHTTFSFSIEKEERVRLEIRDMQGNLKDVVIDQVVENGTHKLDYDLSTYNSGVYVIRMFYGNKIKYIKMSVIK